MEVVVTPAEMRLGDQAATRSGIPGAELMERASHACAVTALRLLGGAYGRRVVVVCGKGNNGGDGVACARHLAAAGVRVTAVVLDDLTGDAGVHLARARRSPADVVTWSADRFRRCVRRADLIVDGVFGTGFAGAPKDRPLEAITAIAAAGTPVLSIDIPSGVSGLDGSVPGAAVRADVTLAIQALKVGHVTPPGAFACGRLDVVDIGIAVQAPTFVPQAADVRAVLPALEPDTHKYDAGALAVLAGSPGMTGAAVLCARGAMRAGAGLVLLGIPSTGLTAVEVGAIEAVKVPLPDVEGQLDAKAVDEFADRLAKARALAVGPGIGRGPRAVGLVRRALDVDLPLVVDADGLWALAEILRDEPDVVRARRHATVLTPHVGEYATLSGDRPPADRVAATREAAARWGAVVHLKGRRAITASPNGHVWINTTGNPGAATGGTGDVLTGIIGSLIAQGAAPEDATWAGAFVHGSAVDVATAQTGRRPMVSSDLPDALVHALRAVHRATQPTTALRTVVTLDANR